MPAEDRADFYDRRIFLFDVDGVIVNPVAYRLGITKTLIELCKKIGLHDIDAMLPEEAEIAAMEAQGVHDVWDITNIAFGDILTKIALQANPIEALSSVPHENISEQLRALRILSPTIARPDYLKLAQAMASTDTHSHPPDIAQKLFQQKLSGVAQFEIWIQLLNRFLIGTRSAYSSYGTRLFQNIILGTKDFERTYELESEYNGVGLLRSEDKTLISPKTVDKLKELCRASYNAGARQNRSAFDNSVGGPNNSIGSPNNSIDAPNNSIGTLINAVGVYTARPSLPPTQAGISPVGYSPEAEIALENAGMQDFPLIGMGMMEWLGKQHNQRTEDLTKPNSTQALAAVINTINGGQDVAALNEAYSIDKQNREPAGTQLSEIQNGRTKVYVFEDTISGIVPLQKTIEMLRTNEFRIELEPLGIATDPSKRAALEKHCKQVFANVNDAFDSIPLD